MFIKYCFEKKSIFSVIEIQGPLVLTGTVPGGLASSGAFDVLYIQLHEKTSLPVFSLISSGGCITHFLVLTVNEVWCHLN